MTTVAKKQPLKSKALQALKDRAIAGDEVALTRLNQEAPDQADALMRVYSLESFLQSVILQKAGIQQNPVVWQATERRCQQLRQELTREGDSPLESLLIERIVVGWLAVQAADLSANLGGDRSFAQGKYYLELQNKTQRRFVAAVKALAQVRRLLGGPVVQVNVAQQGSRQVNVLDGRAGGS